MPSSSLKNAGEQKVNYSQVLLCFCLVHLLYVPRAYVFFTFSKEGR